MGTLKIIQAPNIENIIKSLFVLFCLAKVFVTLSYLDLSIVSQHATKQRVRAKLNVKAKCNEIPLHLPTPAPPPLPHLSLTTRSDMHNRITTDLIERKIGFHAVLKIS